MIEYDPYDHAEQLGITVIHRALRASNGLWLPGHNTIVIQSGLRAVHDRTTLAHELGHAAFGHHCDSQKHENQANKFAANNLIRFDQCVDVMRAAPDEHRAALELGVTTRLLRVFLDLHRLAG